MYKDKKSNFIPSQEESLYVQYVSLCSNSAVGDLNYCLTCANLGTQEIVTSLFLICRIGIKIASLVNIIDLLCKFRNLMCVKAVGKNKN